MSWLDELFSASAGPRGERLIPLVRLALLRVAQKGLLWIVREARDLRGRKVLHVQGAPPPEPSPLSDPSRSAETSTAC